MARWLQWPGFTPPRSRKIPLLLLRRVHYAVLLGAFEQSIHVDAFTGIGGDEQLAASFEFYALFRTKSLGRGRALATKAGLQASRRIIDAGMDHAAVVPGLVPGDGAFFFENNNRGARPRAQNFAGRRQADDSRANNCKIIRHAAVSNRGDESAAQDLLRSGKALSPAGFRRPCRLPFCFPSTGLLRTAFGGGVKQLTEICKSGGIDVRDGPVSGAAVAPDLNRIAVNYECRWRW